MVLTSKVVSVASPERATIVCAGRDCQRRGDGGEREFADVVHVELSCGSRWSEAGPAAHASRKHAPRPSWMRHSKKLIVIRIRIAS
jgi:hypothetical protein